jgi:hypothetical protein
VDQPCGFQPHSASDSDCCGPDQESRRGKIASVPLSVSVGNISRCEWHIQLPIAYEISSFSLKNKQTDDSLIVQIRVQDKDGQPAQRQVSSESAACGGACSDFSVLDCDKDPFSSDFLTPEMLV